MKFEILNKCGKFEIVNNNFACTNTSGAEFRDGVSRITEAGDLNFENLNKCGMFDI